MAVALPKITHPMVTRRGLLIGAAAGGGLLVAWGLTPRTFPLPLDPREGETAFNAWLRIGRDGIVTVAVPQLEMGQGITTLLPQVVAQELGADWRLVAVEPAPVSGAYANVPLAAKWAPLWTPTWMPLAAELAEGADSWLATSYAQRHRFTATADGTAMAAYETPAREAACVVRTLLMQAAARRWGVDWRECKVAQGQVSHGTHRAEFGELAEDAAGFSPPGTLPLGPVPAERTDAYAPGVVPPFARLDLPAKAEGSMTFAGDVRLPDLVFAAIRHAPVAREVSLGHYDPNKAEGAGVRLVRGEGWLAAVAPSWWTAERALAKVAPTFVAKGLVDSARIDAALDKAVKQARTHRIVTVGDPDGAMAVPPSLVARYDVAAGLHAGLETASCTARLRDGRLELWLASQAPEAARRAAAKAVGLRPRDVVLYPVAAGGSFDARLESDHAAEAALIAQEVGKPVQLTWSRWQEHLAGKPRAPASAVLWATTRSSGEVPGQPSGGEVLAWKARIATPAAAREFGRRLFGEMSARDALAASTGEADPMALEGALPPYALANVSVDHVPVSTGIPAGRLRGNAHGMTAFFTESFVDELARAAGREPLSYRIEMLGNDLRLAECLQRAASLAEWGGGNDQSGQGLACHRIGEGRIAVIATAVRDAAGVRVEKISAVADIGRIVNLDLARQQIEGGLVFGLGLTLGASTGYARGLPISGRLAGLGLPLLANTPEIAVGFVQSDAPSADPGELGVAAIAPAIANALHSATGIRFRKLPLSAEEV